MDDQPVKKPRAKRVKKDGLVVGQRFGEETPTKPGDTRIRITDIKETPRVGTAPANITLLDEVATQTATATPTQPKRTRAKKAVPSATRLAVAEMYKAIPQRLSPQAQNLIHPQTYRRLMGTVAGKVLQIDNRPMMRKTVEPCHRCGKLPKPHRRPGGYVAVNCCCDVFSGPGNSFQSKVVEQALTAWNLKQATARGGGVKTTVIHLEPSITGLVI